MPKHATETKLANLPIHQFSSFEEVGTSLSVGSGTSTQGIAFDGTFFYVTATSTVYKYNTSGVLQTSRNISTDVAGNSHVGDGVVVGSVLYLPLNNYPTTPKTTVIARYNTSDLSLIGSTSLGAFWAGTMTHKDNEFWILEENYILKRWNTALSSSTSYTLPVSLYSTEGVYDYDGVEWIGDSLLINPHAGASPNVIQQFSFDGTSFTRVRTMTRPINASQGMVWSATNQRMYFATRESSALILTTQPVPDDNRRLRVESIFSTTAYSTTSTSYVEDTNTASQVSIHVRKGDIIRVDLMGIYSVTANGLRVYIAPTTGTASVASVYTTSDTPTVRSNSTAADKTSLTGFRLFKANSTGNVTFTTYNRVTAAATLNREQIYLVAQVIGYDVESYT